MQTAATEPRNDDSSTPSRLGDAAWIAGWIAILALLFQQIASPNPWILFPLGFFLAVAIGVQLGISMYRSIRRRWPRSETATLVDIFLRADERQHELRIRCQAIAGQAVQTFGVLLLLIGLAAMAARVRIESVESWIALIYAMTYGILGTYKVAMQVAARHYSRKG